MSARQRPIAVIGAGGHGKIVIATLQDAGYSVDAVFDDDPARLGARVLGIPVVGGTADLARGGARAAVIAIASNTIRQRIAGGLEDMEWLTVVHPRAYVHPSVKLGAGTVVIAGAVVQPDTTIGAHSIINTGATVDHDCVIGDFVHVAPGVHLAGSVRVDHGAFMGTAACAIPGRRVGAWAVVGAGGVVIHDIPEHVTAVGTPARWKMRHD